MPVGEFDLIERYFVPLGVQGAPRRDVTLGIGDDGAVLRMPAGHELVASIDTLVAGRHFLADSDPVSVGHRALAVNLSDLAAMGAAPAWCLLAITLPTADEGFLEGFARGFGSLAALHDVVLVGGDTTAGPLSISVQVMGLVPQGTALRRDGGAVGDLLFVSGTPGDAAAGLLLERGPAGGLVAPASAAAADVILRQRLLYPTPRLRLGGLLRGLATACIDVSDGLAADAGKLAAASGCGLRLEVDELPLSAALVQICGNQRALELALTGGDDYELCFTLPPARLAELPDVLIEACCAARCIGVLDETPGIRIRRRGVPWNLDPAGFDHFPTRDP